MATERSYARPVVMAEIWDQYDKATLKHISDWCSLLSHRDPKFSLGALSLCTIGNVIKTLESGGPATPRSLSWGIRDRVRIMKGKKPVWLKTRSLSRTSGSI